MNIVARAGLFSTKIVTRFDPRYRPAWRSCINLYAIAARRLLTISRIVGMPESSAKTVL